MGGVGSGAAEEDWHGDLNPGTAAMQGREACDFGAPFATQLRKVESKM